jgi:carbonic anhydrase/acetyltransferase-like protein (isoleucine patch superfamily)
MAIYDLDGICVQTPPAGQFWVAPSATVLGNVRLERDTSVWFGAVIRGDNELIHLMEGSNVQDGSVLHTDAGFPLTLGPRSLVGHQAMLHGCTIGTNTLIGIGSIVLNGCRIGDNCIIGAHSILPEGKVIPSGSVVMGSPGKIVRQMTEKDIARVKADVQFYVDNGRKFARGLVQRQA